MQQQIDRAKAEGNAFAYAVLSFTKHLLFVVSFCILLIISITLGAIAQAYPYQSVPTIIFCVLALKVYLDYSSPDWPERGP